MRTTGLVVLFNHNYEGNIPLIKEYYKKRFPVLRILMPFYYGDDEEVIGVYGHSFVFQTYIAQAREKLMQMPCDDFLIIGDDLILNPDIHAENVHSFMGIDEGAFYIDGVADIAGGEFWRPLREARLFRPLFTGLDPSANRILPSKEDAFNILKSKGVISSLRLYRWKPFMRPFKKGLVKNFRANLRAFMSRCYHLMQMVRHRVFPVTMPYPCVFGYSDIIMIPREHMVEYCRYLEVFATWRMFVEMAIPTAMMLMTKAKVCFAGKSGYKLGNVWCPQDAKHYKETNAVIDGVMAKVKNVEELSSYFPRDYMYLHPVKMSGLHKRKD